MIILHREEKTLDIDQTEEKCYTINMFYACTDFIFSQKHTLYFGLIEICIITFVLEQIIDLDN